MGKYVYFSTLYKEEAYVGCQWQIVRAESSVTFNAKTPNLVNNICLAIYRRSLPNMFFFFFRKQLIT